MSLQLEIMNRMVTAERNDGWWLVEPFRHAPIKTDGKWQYGEDIAGPFKSEQEVNDFYIRMDYE